MFAINRWVKKSFPINLCGKFDTSGSETSIVTWYLRLFFSNENKNASLLSFTGFFLIAGHAFPEAERKTTEAVDPC